MAETPAEALKASVERQKMQRDAAKSAVTKASEDIANERAESADTGVQQ